MKHIRKTLAVLLAALLLAALPVTAAAQTPAEAKNSVLGYIAQTVKAPGFGDEWFVLGQARGGVVSPDYYATYYARAESYVKARGSAKLSATKATENARLILALSAIGKNAGSVGGYDLTAPLADMDWVTGQGVNGPIYALIALDAGGYGTQAQRDAILAYILEQEMPGGGWSFSGAFADPDTTSMALQALAAHKAEGGAADAIGRAVTVLSGLQNGNGAFAHEDEGINAESTAQVIIGLTAVGIDPMTDGRFLKAGGNPVGALLGHQLANGGFKHKAEDTAADGMATEQAARALVAYDRFLSGESGLFAMDDAEDLTAGGTVAQPPSGSTGQPAPPPVDEMPPRQLKWWEKLPAFLQLLLRILCFGWIWMR